MCVKSKNQTGSVSSFYCTQCGNKSLYVFRVKGQEREPGHLKNLYCPHCRKECNSAECKDGGKYTYYDFKLEFEYGNFTETGLRKMPYTQFIADLIDKGVVDT